jgi:hypothetical protein
VFAVPGFQPGDSSREAFAAPTLTVFEHSSPPKRVALRGFRQNEQLYAELKRAAGRGPAPGNQAPQVHMFIFGGPGWDALAADSGMLARLPLGWASDTALYYPRTAGRETPIVRLDGLLMRANARATIMLDSIGAR